MQMTISRISSFLIQMMCQSARLVRELELLPQTPLFLTLPDDNCLDNEPAGERDAIASQITAPEPQLEKVAEHDEEDINITGPAANRIPGVAAAKSAVQDDDATSQ